jgi:nitrate reductase NapD
MRMNICGVLVHALPAKAGAVIATLREMDGVEVHQTGGDGRLVVTVEDAATSSAGETLLAIHRIEGVVNASLVYHHAEPVEPAEPRN